MNFRSVGSLSAGTGLWPALWLRTPEKLPFDGEIDVVEAGGSHPDSLMSTVHHWQNAHHLGSQCATIHYNNPGRCEPVDVALPAGHDFSTDYHTFSIEWRADHITWFLDGKPYFTARDYVPQMPMRLVLELHVGGSFDGPVTADTPSTVSMDVARVRVFQ